MKSNIEILESLGWLDDIRQRLDWEEGNDFTKVDAKINKMAPKDIVAEWCAWHIGYADWWQNMKNGFDKLVVESRSADTRIKEGLVGTIVHTYETSAIEIEFHTEEPFTKTFAPQ